MIIEVTDEAKKELDEILKSSDDSKHLRIYVAGHG